MSKSFHITKIDRDLQIKASSAACERDVHCCCDIWLRLTTLPGRSSTSGLIKPCLHEASRRRQAMCCSAKKEWPSQPALLSKMEISPVQTDNASQRQRLYSRPEHGCAWFASFDKTAPHSFKALLVFQFRFARAADSGGVGMTL